MIKAKKSLGQNFLIDQNVLGTIVESANLEERDLVLEIGPGKGILTDILLKAGARVIAVEKDDRLIEPLENHFEEEIGRKKLKLVHADILEWFQSDPPKIKNEYKLIANIPYYLTGQILRLFLSADKQPTIAILMLQREVAERIVAKNKKESLLSISVKAFGKPEYIRTVRRGSFRPIPKVDSAILRISDISRKNFQKISEEKFFELIHRGFDQKRKMLRGKLKINEESFSRCGINPESRAEDLNINQWLCLASNL